MNSYKFELYVALRYLKSKRQEVFISIITVISVLGVAISVMVLDMVLAIMTGFTEELQKKLLNANAHIVARSYGGGISDWKALSEELKEHPEILSVSPFTYNQVMVMTEGGARGMLVRGLSQDDTPRTKLLEVVKSPQLLDALFAKQVIQITRPDGELDEVSLPPLLIGNSLQQKLALQAGEPITLLAPQMTASPRGLIPRSKRFAVIGSYKSGLIEYEEGMAYTNIKEAQRFFKMGDQVSGLEIELKDLWDAKAISEGLTANSNKLQRGLYFTDWSEPNKALWEALKLEKRVYFIVLLLLIMVASFSIVSTLVMMVMEKRKDIAILKAMGAKNSQVLRIFLMQGILIGALGTIVGTILGYLGCIALREYGFEIQETVFSLSTVPVHMIPSNFMLVAIAAFIITSLAGVYPALRAGATRTADILRFD